MTFLKTTVLAGVVCLTAFLGYKYLTADPPGYCEKNGRVYTNEEALEYYVQGLIDADMIKLAPSEKTALDYIRNHPCNYTVYFGRGQQISPDWLTRNFGPKGFRIYITYEMSEKARKHYGAKGITSDSTHYEVFYSLSPCLGEGHMGHMEAGMTGATTKIFNCTEPNTTSKHEGK